MVSSNSLSNIMGGSKQAMVYGFNDCLYGEISKQLNETLIKVFSYTIGGLYRCDETIEERQIKKMFFDFRFKSLERECKTGIMNLIFENYKRKKEDLLIIPLIFCVDYEDKSITCFNHTSINSERVFNKNDYYLNGLITHKELRRCYKVYHEYKDSEDPELRLLSDVAKETFKFVKVIAENRIPYDLIEVKPFWKDGNAENEWAKRTQSAKGISKKMFFWREELEEEIIEYNKIESSN